VKHRGPLITLVVVLGALVLVLSLNDALIPNHASGPVVSTRPRALPASVFTGKDEAGKMAVAIAVKDGKAVGYLCDGRSIEAWLTGTEVSGHVTLEASKGDATIYADVNRDSVAGIAAVGDDEFDFNIDRAAPPAGLYRKKDDKTTIGWIILPDGRQVGIANTNGNKAPAPTLDLKTGKADLVTGETR
jgi:hypothetical protein